ncbi:acyltransferase [Colwellia psychrerythraea]|uniref:Acyltransferase 3 n=1 Tax=Colwellia psychrerythraea TaxID=28229 RepID=A0A099L1C7_COLPS|nr:acyltransferase [Colwellia psychrerythraea]KGJ96789.1 acyltransferase 3 [Colwellia psychrerythraea]
MFLGYIHSFRALAILFIVAGHSIDFFDWSADDSDVERWLRILISNGSVLFVFIAGYLFQHLASKYQHKKYFVGKLKNVLIPYFFVSIPAIYIFVFVLTRETVWQGFYDNPQWLQIVYFYLTGLHLAPLWFIPMITLFYIVAPLLIWGDKKKNFYWILPVAILVSCFVSRGFPQQSFVHFFSVYLLGMYCSHFKSRLNGFFSRTDFLFVLAIIVMGFACWEYYLMQGTMTYVNYLQKICMSVLFLGLLIRLGSKIDSKLIRTIADTSFGVFFIHSYVLTTSKLLFEKLSDEKIAGNLLFYPIVSIAILMTCVVIIFIIQKLMGNKSRYLVGS